MKTDNDNMVRVTVTFNREGNPEWYALLKSISSGTARAAVVRSHLALPSADRFPVLAKQNPSLPPQSGGQEGDKASAEALQTAPAAAVSKNQPAQVNSSDSSPGPTSKNLDSLRENNSNGADFVNTSSNLTGSTGEIPLNESQIKEMKVDNSLKSSSGQSGQIPETNAGNKTENNRQPSVSSPPRTGMAAKLLKTGVKGVEKT